MRRGDTVKRSILFSAPHNARETDYVRVNNWQEVREYFAPTQGGQSRCGGTPFFTNHR